MTNYDEIRKVLMMQKNSREVLDNLKPIFENENCLTFMILNAYHLGVITAKRAERTRRAQR